MFNQIFTQAKEIKLKPIGYNSYEVTCLTEQKQKDSDTMLQVEFTFPVVALEIKAQAITNEAEQPYYMKIVGGNKEAKDETEVHR